jgi:hypothetical protein
MILHALWAAVLMVCLFFQWRTTPAQRLRNIVETTVVPALQPNDRFTVFESLRHQDPESDKALQKARQYYLRFQHEARQDTPDEITMMRIQDKIMGRMHVLAFRLPNDLRKARHMHAASEALWKDLRATMYKLFGTPWKPFPFRPADDEFK